MKGCEIMSRKRVTYIVCEICGREEEIRTFVDFEKEGWQKVGSGDYCPDCLKPTRELLKKSMTTEEWLKVEDMKKDIEPLDDDL